MATYALCTAVTQVRSTTGGEGWGGSTYSPCLAGLAASRRLRRSHPALVGRPRVAGAAGRDRQRHLRGHRCAGDCGRGYMPTAPAPTLLARRTGILTSAAAYNARGTNYNASAPGIGSVLRAALAYAQYSSV